MPEACKRYPFRAEPLRIGHYREYTPSHRPREPGLFGTPGGDEQLDAMQRFLY